MSQQNIKEIAKHLVSAEVNKKEIDKVTMTHKPDLTVEDAYKVQDALVDIKLNEGRKIVGPKMGLTSKAKMDQMNVEEPIYGYVFDYMLIENGGEVRLSDLIHPRVEAEIAFVMEEDVEGPGITGAQILANTKAVLPALEIIDSRYKNFNFTLPDVIADNASTSRVVFGSKLTPVDNLDVELIGSTVSINGKVVDLGAGAAVLGHPANAIAMLANMLARKGEKIKKGDIILSGALTAATFIHEGDSVLGKFDGLGDVQFTVVK